ncbi:MAG: glycosyltransferase family 4 protein [Pirellulales bacterium]|nr:glycosyltransferase family 4 protein [Pirellulales bacterium]
MAQRGTSCLIVGALAPSLVNFRGPLIQALRARGLTVYAAANGRDAGVEAQLASWGVQYFPIHVARAGMNPLADALTLFDLFRIMRRVRPDMVLAYTIKPVVYAALAARLAGVRSVYSLITGLGYTFMDGTSPRQRLAGRLARLLYGVSLSRSRRVFFQNPDDAATFVDAGLVASDRVVAVNGSGVDLDHFPFVGLDHASGSQGGGETRRKTNSPVRFLLIARLLRDKGIREYVAAARIVKCRYPWAEFHLIGPFDSNPAGLQPDEVRQWQNEGTIRYHGPQSDVRPFLRDCHVYVLPSYREGTPRTVLEAMATGRAVITTDAPGCRETVRHEAPWLADEERRESDRLKIGENGILVPVKDADALAAAMEYCIENPEQIALMGRAGRRYAEERYDVRQVNAVMLREMFGATAKGGGRERRRAA